MQYLDKSDTRLKLALQATKSGMWEWHFLTGQVAWSENFEAVWGLAPSTLKGTYKSLLQQICVQDRRFVTRSLARAIRKQANYSIEFRIHCPDGSIRWLKSEGEVYGDGVLIRSRLLDCVRTLPQTSRQKERRVSRQLINRKTRNSQPR